MKGLGRSTQMNIYNTESLIFNSQACLGHLAVGRSLRGGRLQIRTQPTINKKWYYNQHTTPTKLLVKNVSSALKFFA